MLGFSVASTFCCPPACKNMLFGLVVVLNFDFVVMMIAELILLNFIIKLKEVEEDLGKLLEKPLERIQRSMSWIKIWFMIEHYGVI